jgi:diaminohydroxyphosphoribosylaminopyrimidine deaminase/5-amino-6-(5-phosphoribosylamino)uracil reductase
MALTLARQALWLTTPNPRVGCVIADAAGNVLGLGHTQRAGGAHAEIMALEDAQSRNNPVIGATAYVTLEPCAHQGRTGPCCVALANAGIGKVVASIRDPNPLVAGQGLDHLRAAGIEVEVGLFAAESRELNIGFFSRLVRQTPWVRMKVAASLDGKTALQNGASQWITSPAARADGHTWRARACAILTGVGTVLADDPRLDVRGVDTPRQPAVVVVDSQLRTPADALLFVADRACYIYTAASNDQKIAALESRGAHVILMGNGHGAVDLTAMQRDLARRGINELHVEAGATLNGALLRDGLVDEMLLYLAPMLIGSHARGMAHTDALENLAQAAALDFRSVELIGPDLRILARIRGLDRF